MCRRKTKEHFPGGGLQPALLVTAVDDIILLAYRRLGGVSDIEHVEAERGACPADIRWW